MALYLVVHNPKDETGDDVRAPSRLAELARSSVDHGTPPRWLKTWSPDLHDDRIFSLWEADDAASIKIALTRFGFLDDMEADPLRVRAWGPDDVLAAESG